MLRTPAPFPQVGSFVLFDHEGRRQLARLVAKDLRTGEITISLPERTGAGGNVTTNLESLIDGTPLTDAELAERAALESQVRPFLRGEKRARTEKQRTALKRFVSLAERAIHSTVLAEKIARYEERQRAEAA